MDLIEVDNPSLRCMVLKIYARPSLDLRRIGELVDLLSTPAEGHAGLCLRAFPRLVRLRRGQGLRRVLHTSVRRQAARGGARAHEQASVRRVLRLRRHGSCRPSGSSKSTAASTELLPTSGSSHHIYPSSSASSPGRLGPHQQTGTTVTYTLSHPLVVDLLTVIRSRLHEVINDRIEHWPNRKPTSPTSECP